MKSPRILLIGRSGQVGSRLLSCLQGCAEVVAPSRAEVDLADGQGSYAAVLRYAPAFVINAAAYTAVDRAETEEAMANAVNGTACSELARGCAEVGAQLIHYSTDYVFDGTKDGCYIEEDIPAPLSAYGRSKLLGEQLVAASGARYIILRCSWVYDVRGKNFLKTMLRLASEGQEIRVVDNQIGAPTSALEIARATTALIDKLAADARPVTGLYHMTCRGETSWYGFAHAIFQMSRPADLESGAIKLCPAQHFAAAAMRPGNSRLCTAKLLRDFGIELPHWQESLRETILAQAGAENSTL